MRDAAAAAHADEFIRRLPEGYETLVRRAWGSSSLVARNSGSPLPEPFLKNPELIILDEATSALDSESEYHVQQGLGRLVQGKSSVIIAHRLSTIMNADQIW